MTSITSTQTTQPVLLSAAKAKIATSFYYEAIEYIINEISNNQDKYGNISVEDLRKLVSAPEFKVKKPVEKKVKLQLENWETCNSLELLMSLKGDELKNILSSNSLSIKGSKANLANRVLSINFPEQASVEETPKKKGRPKKINDKVEVINDEKMNLEEMLETAETIYFKDSKGVKTITKTVNETKYKLIKSKNWVFQDNDEGYEFIGILDKKILVQDGEPPDELTNLYESE